MSAPTIAKTPIGNFHCWLWPDHEMGKRESRRLRDEHNACINALADANAVNADLLTACKVLLTWCEMAGEGDSDMCIVARAAIASAEGGQT